MPSVIRALIPERITCQYKQYCQEEVRFIPFSQKTMLRILSACSATDRKTLQDLDYVAADGASVFHDLAKFLQQHLHLVTASTLERWQRTLKNGKFYLKGDFKLKETLSDQKVFVETSVLMTGRLNFKEKLMSL